MSDQQKHFFIVPRTAPQDDAVAAGTSRTILGHDDSLMMLKMDFKKGVVGAMHHHMHTQATYVLSGSFEFTIGEETRVVSQGDACFMPANIPHGCTCLATGTLLDVFTPERKDFLE